MAVRGMEKNWLALVGVLLMMAGGTAHAACELQVGRFVSITGSVDVQSTGGGTWTSAKLNTRLCEGDTIRVGERSRAAVSLINDAVLRIDQNTAMRLIDITPQEEESSLLDLFTGAFKSFSRKPKYLKVNTPYLNGSVEGTEFAVRIQDSATAITVFEGVVIAANAQGEVAVKPGEEARAVKGQAPQRRTVVRPEEQVQWALYYPPILSVGDLAGKAPALARAANCLANGNTACTFRELDGVPRSARDADYLLLRATALLAVGRVDEARGDIDNALKQDGQASAAHALRAVINVAQNRREAALTDARRAVELDPASAAAKIALSYALQANLELGAARDTLLQAVTQSPDDALAWARLAELQLADGNRKEANAAAARAVELQPGLSRTQNVLGFAALAEIDTAQAQAAFEEAVALDSADPLPRLGLGLAKIRQGMLAEGRADLEAAVALDSNNALLRAYLGKAYFEEKRGPLDAQQFEIAKRLDPLDPTAYFYNAIGLQTGNRPVEALREFEASVERNDNRAVYRGQLLLDQDRAARGTSQARVFENLGFLQLGVIESSRSLALDPANSSAHRFLSDSYRNVQRREIARVSALLQAQMLQDINTNPIQPSVSATNLNIVTQGGPASAGFNEFTPLFERNETQFDATGALGNNDTVSGEVVVSGLYDNVSLSAGAFYFDTDGYHDNNDLKHNIYNLYGQVALTPALNFQFEYGRQGTENGDLEMNFDPDSYDASFRRDFDADVFRLGARFSPDSASDFIISLIFSDREENKSFSDEQLIDFLPFPFPIFTAVTDSVSRVEEDAYQAEAQYLRSGDSYNITAGVAYADVDQDIRLDQTVTTPFGVSPQPPFVDKPDIYDSRVYLYGNFRMPMNVTWTAGLSYQDYDEDAFDRQEWNPKLGVQWDISDSLRLRGAYFEVLKPALAANRTLEPTQIAGFNQLFDDANATWSQRYGGALDWRAMRDLSLGVSASKRNIETAVFLGADADFEDRDEWLHNAYAYWTPTDRLAISAEAVYDKFEAEKDALDVDLPREVRTVSFPLKARYFHPSGLFGEIGMTYVDQEVERSSFSELAEGDDDFTVVDLAVGYRLPKRQGIISLSVQNLFDEEFRYQDDSFRTFEDEPSVARYRPERMIMGRVTVNF